MQIVVCFKHRLWRVRLGGVCMLAVCKAIGFLQPFVHIGEVPGFLAGCNYANGNRCGRKRPGGINALRLQQAQDRAAQSSQRAASSIMSFVRGAAALV